MEQGILYQNNNLKSINTDYIYLKIGEKAEGKPCEKDLPLMKNDITKILRPQKPVIYSSYVVCLIMLLEFNSIHIVLFILFPENIKNPYNSFNSL
jgi:hypothetical protein